MGHYRGRTLKFGALWPALGFVLALNGCMSMSSFQTGEALKPGSVSIGLALTSSAMEGEGEVGGQAVKWEMDQVPTGELLARIGVARNFDAGLKGYLAVGGFAWTLDGKYQFLDGEGFDAAMVLGGGISEANVLYDAVTAEGDDGKAEWVDTYLAVPMTWRLSGSSSVTLAPRFVRRDIAAELSGEKENFAGASLTLSLGANRYRVRPEIAYFVGDSDTTIAFGGLGLFLEE